MLLIILVITYFAGFSFYSLMYYIGLLIFKTVMSCIKKFYSYTKRKAELILIKKERDKEKMSDALRKGI